MDWTKKDLETMVKLCDFMIEQEKWGKFVPGHRPDLGCGSECLSLQAKHLKEKISFLVTKDVRVQNDEDLEQFLASRVCAFGSRETATDFREHFKGCAWCQEYVLQRQEAKKYIIYNEGERPRVAGDDSERC